MDDLRALAAREALTERAAGPLLPLIVIEGPDASGTTTHATRLAAALGAPYGKEPTESAWGRLARDALRDGVHDLALMLFAQDRQAHCQALAVDLQGGPVVLDRYLPSSLAYQGPRASYSRVWRYNHGVLVPRVCVWLWCDVDTRMARLSRRAAVDPWETRAEQVALDMAYKTTRYQCGARWQGCVHIDALSSGNVDTTAGLILQGVRLALGCEG